MTFMDFRYVPGLMMADRRRRLSHGEIAHLVSLPDLEVCYERLRRVNQRIFQAQQSDQLDCRFGACRRRSLRLKQDPA